MNNFMFKMNGVMNAIGLVEVSRLNIEKKYPFDVDPLPKNPSGSALNKRYLMLTEFVLVAKERINMLKSIFRRPGQN